MWWLATGIVVALAGAGGAVWWLRRTRAQDMRAIAEWRAGLRGQCPICSLARHAAVTGLSLYVGPHRCAEHLGADERN